MTDLLTVGLVFVFGLGFIGVTAGIALGYDRLMITGFLLGAVATFTSFLAGAALLARVLL